MAPSGGEFNPGLMLLRGLGTTMLVGFALYVYFGITVMLIARKTRTPNAWLAWLPIGNLFLMCHVGRRPGWWVVLLLIPVVNILFVAMIWMAMAETRGKPAWTGALALIPGVGLLVPVYLATGAATDPDAPMGSPAACLRCGTAVTSQDAYCGDCGERLPAPTSALKRMPAGQLALVAAGMVLLLAAVSYGVGSLTIGRALAYSAPERKAPGLPQRMAGTMTEFPVDTDPSLPARPDAVVLADLNPTRSGSSPASSVPKDWLPPGASTDRLARRASNITAATYRRRRGEKPVTVAVLRRRPGTRSIASAAGPRRIPAPPVLGANGEGAGMPAAGTITDKGRGPGLSPAGTIADDIADAVGGKETGVRVQSPAGAVYTGVRVRTDQITIYILDKQGTDITILVYAADPSVFDTADRLAGNVDNGEGLDDDPEVKDAVWSLPASPPEGLVLEEMSTMTPESLGLTEEAFREASREAGSQEARRLISSIRQFAPERFTAVRYGDRSRHDWGVLISDYGSSTRAWNLWMLVRWSFGTGMEPTPVLGITGLQTRVDDTPFLLFQKGPYLVCLVGPKSAPPDRLLKIAGGMQM